MDLAVVANPLESQGELRRSHPADTVYSHRLCVQSIIEDPSQPCQRSLLIPPRKRSDGFLKTRTLDGYVRLL